MVFPKFHFPLFIGTIINIVDEHIDKVNDIYRKSVFTKHYSDYFFYAKTIEIWNDFCPDCNQTQLTFLQERHGIGNGFSKCCKEDSLKIRFLLCNKNDYTRMEKQLLSRLLVLGWTVTILSIIALCFFLIINPLVICYSPSITVTCPFLL